MTAAADQELEPASALAEVHHQIPGLLSGPGASWTGGDARDVHGPAVDLHYEQDMHALEQHGVYVQEVARQDAGRRAGPRPAAARIRRIVPSPTRWPKPISSPWVRR